MRNKLAHVCISEGFENHVTLPNNEMTIPWYPTDKATASITQGDIYNSTLRTEYILIQHNAEKDVS